MGSELERALHVSRLVGVGEHHDRERLQPLLLPRPLEEAEAAEAATRIGISRSLVGSM
jgi:hypothetical protein